MDQVRNEEVQRRTGAMRVGWSSRGVCVLSWFGRMERMEEDQLVKTIIGSNVRGLRLRGRGRPRMEWMDGVKRALNERRMFVEQGRMIAHDRSGWKTVMNA